MFKSHIVISEKVKYFLLLALILAPLAFLRFYNLGWSEYIPDETTVMTPVKLGYIDWEFLLVQRKGPMQFLLAGALGLLKISVFNELAYRIPFALASLAGLFFFFKFVEKVSGKFAAAVATLLLGLNGFLVAFGRIVQYQNLNLLFSFAGLYFLAKAADSDKKAKQYFLSGLFLTLSALSHWDVVFILLPALYLFFKNLGSGPILSSEKLKTILYFFIPVLVSLIFFIPYLQKTLNIGGNVEYLNTRVNLVNLDLESFVGRFNEYIFKTEVYNPFIFLYAICGLALLGSISTKKAYPFFFWFVFNLLLFLIFVKKPGTHVYNMFLPLSVLAGFGADYLFSLFNRKFGYVALPALIVLVGFLFYQNYLIFLDSSIQYPWQQEKIYNYVTRQYTDKTLSNNVIGFPLRRGWKEAREFLLAEQQRTGVTLPFISNEAASIGGFYLDLKHGYPTDPAFYAIGVKRPLSFVNDYTFPQIRGKKTIDRISINGENFIKIYLVTKDD